LESGFVAEFDNEKNFPWRDPWPSETPLAPRQFLSGLYALRHQVAERASEVVLDALRQSGLSPQQVEAIGLLDYAGWSTGEGGRCIFLELCDPATLALRCGLPVVSGFAENDLAAGGRGGPLTPVPLWWKLAQNGKRRILLDLGRSVSLIFLPPKDSANGPAELLAFHAGPGTELLDRLAIKLTAGRQPFDPGGTLAVQGQKIPELREKWLSDSIIRSPIPRWYPGGVPVDRFLCEGLQAAIEKNWSVRDLLCTATHLVAEIAARAVEKVAVARGPLDEVLITGGGQNNGLLLAELTKSLAPLPLVRLSPSEGSATLGALSAALLAALYLEQLPGNCPAITGAESPKILGRLTLYGRPIELKHVNLPQGSNHLRWITHFRRAAI